VAYRQLAEIVRQLGGSDPSRWLDEVLEGDEQAARLVLSAIGLSGRAAQAELKLEGRRCARHRYGWCEFTRPS
jgi:hypothetical protein